MKHSMDHRFILPGVAVLLALFLSACALTSMRATPLPVVTQAPAATITVAAAQPLPDLTLAQVGVWMQGSPESGSNCVKTYAPYVLRAFVENHGTLLAMNIPIVEQSTGYAIQIGNLEAGQRMEIFIPLSSPDGQYRLVIDPQNTVAESDKSNNRADYLAITPTPPALCTPAASAQTPEPSAWKSYRNDSLGFTFEYPAVYEDPAYQQACGLKASETGVRVGQRIELQFLDPGGLSLADYAASLLKGKDWSVDSQQQETIGGLDALTIQYRYGGANRFGTLSLVEHAGRILAFNFTAGSFCPAPGEDAAEPAAYAHLLKSLHFES